MAEYSHRAPRVKTVFSVRTVILGLFDYAGLLSSRSSQWGEEMAFRAIGVALLLSCLPIAGCGTVANLVKPGPEGGGKSPFGGVRHDVSCIKKAANGDFGYRTPLKAESGPRPQVVRTLCYAADLPLTVIGDVVTWPYAAAYTCINQPIPTPPVRLAPYPPVIQATAEGPPQTSPVELLPGPKKLPE